MRILVVPFTFPWPMVHGTRIRVANVVEGLARLGEVEVFAMHEPDQDPIEGDPTVVPPGVPAIRSTAVPRGRLPKSRMKQVRWLLQSELPSILYGRDMEGPRRAFRSWIHEPYDLVWFHRAEAYLTLGGLVDAPVILDLDVLDDQWIEQRMIADAEQGPRGGLKRRVDDALGRRNARMFESLHRRLAGEVETLVVCSEEDRRRLGVSNAVVVPNGFDPPERPAGSIQVGDPPTILFHGTLTRPAKVQAAEFLVRRVMPLVRSRLPDVRVRLAGRAAPRLERLSDPPRVLVTGWVPDMADELALADVVAVPMRYAGGTLLKVLEAFAHRVPVVATSVGARGLEVEDGKHVLIADSAQDFADACVRLLTDLDLRRSLAGAAHTLFLERFRWGAIHDRIAEVGSSAAAARRHA